MGAIVTPEAVVLEFETAGVGSRMVARIIDSVLQGLLLVALLLASAVVAAVAGSIGLAGVFVSLFAVVFIYPVAFETLWRGRTPGKAALGLRVVTVEGAPIRFRHAAIRAFLALIDIYLLSGAIGVVTMLASSRSQRLGDMVAGTVVLRERTGARMPTAVVFAVPPGYESYAASIDVNGLTASDYGAVRAFLLRAPSLEPARRYELARQIATPLLLRLRHTPPAWVGPEALLACVAAVYQYRSRPVPQGPQRQSPQPHAPPPFLPPGERPAVDAIPTEGYAPPT
jgi:uncharacterized RDD family membrane protein YckC